MDPKSISRKDFFVLTFTLIGGATAASACSSSSNNNDGQAGAGGGAGRGGTGGGAGAGGTGGAAGTGGQTCMDPLPETQVTVSSTDLGTHEHTLMITAAQLNSTADLTLQTNVQLAHMHAVVFTLANLATLKGGGMVTVESMPAGTPSHTHSYLVSCHALGDASAGQ
jgi:hypothetical protein